MLGRLIPQELGFFDLFKESGDIMVAAVREYRKMLDYPAEMQSRAQSIKDLEHQADDVTHRTMLLLHKTFITPLDRDDIYNLIKTMDDILDFIDASAQRLHLYDVQEIPGDIKLLADVTVKSVVLVRNAVQLLTNMKNAKEIFQICIEINHLENEADQIMRTAVARLFRDEEDIKRMIKLKENYELLETVTDRCEDVANVIESIVLEYA
jgi:predicted phosphate transport protein (TIGR00153 family)